jgi:hypothetical protein
MPGPVYHRATMRRLPRFHPRTRRRLTWLVVLLLAWQQLAVAAYACTMPSVAAPVAMAGADRMAMEDSCPSMHDGQGLPPLCQAHCHPVHAAQPDARTGSVPPSLFAALPVTAGAVSPAALDLAAQAPERRYRLRAPPPPASLLFCSLLI